MSNFQIDSGQFFQGEVSDHENDDKDDSVLKLPSLKNFSDFQFFETIKSADKSLN